MSSIILTVVTCVAFQKLLTMALMAVRLPMVSASPTPHRSAASRSTLTAHAASASDRWSVGMAASAVRRSSPVVASVMFIPEQYQETPEFARAAADQFQQV